MEHINKKVTDMIKFGFLAFVETSWAFGTSVAANSVQL